ncbi:MAG: DNA repair protein RecO [Nannocystaceae bacterium]
MRTRIVGRAEPAIVLRTRPLGEADLIVVLLTVGGKVDAVAPSGRRSRKRFTGGFAPGMRGVATVAKGKGTLMRLSEFDPTSDHTPVGRDLMRFAFVAYVCELADEFIGMDARDPVVYTAVESALSAIIDRPPKPAMLRRFELQLLASLGFLSPLGGCCVCRQRVFDGEDVSGEVGFDPGRGGVLCPQHSGGLYLPAASVLHAVALAEHHEEQTAEVFAAIEAAPVDVRRGLRDLTYGLIREHLRRPLKSLAFFAQIPREG